MCCKAFQIKKSKIFESLKNFAQIFFEMCSKNNQNTKSDSGLMQV